MKPELHDVWRVTYATIEELQWQGDVRPVLVAANLPLSKALELAEAYGFGYCAKPSHLRAGFQ